MREREKLTEEQEKVWHFILGFYSDNEIVPALEEIGDHFGYSKQNAQYKIKSLIRKGYLMERKSVVTRSYALRTVDKVNTGSTIKT